jgi:hypothetical protein
MPVGCEYNYVVFRKQSLILARQNLETSSDRESKEWLEAMLKHRHSDSYLVALQDEGSGFDLNDLHHWEDALGLKWNDGYESVDFFIPNDEVSICPWLEFSLVRAINNFTPHCHLVAWDTYRHIEDNSRLVIVDFTGPEEPYTPDFFPLFGEPIDTSRYDGLNFEMMERKPSWYFASQKST